MTDAEIRAYRLKEALTNKLSQHEENRRWLGGTLVTALVMPALVLLASLGTLNPLVLAALAVTALVLLVCYVGPVGPVENVAWWGTLQVTARALWMLLVLVVLTNSQVVTITANPAWLSPAGLPWQAVALLALVAESALWAHLSYLYGLDCAKAYRDYGPQLAEAEKEPYLRMVAA